MDTREIVSELDAEIARLQQAREFLIGIGTPAKRKPGRPAGTKSPSKTASLRPQKPTGKSKPRRTLSPEARARIAAAQKARWAKTRKMAAADTK